MNSVSPLLIFIEAARPTRTSVSRHGPTATTYLDLARDYGADNNVVVVVVIILDHDPFLMDDDGGQLIMVLKGG